MGDPGLRLSLIPGGTFTRLVEQDATGQTVRISPFHCQDAPVSVGTYRTYLEAAGHRPAHVLEVWDGAWVPGPTFEEANSYGEDKAVVGVSYDDALAFIEWLSEREARRFRLPTEAEFEYAARSDCRCTVACRSAREHRPAAAAPVLPSGRPKLCPWPVRAAQANNFGIWDMHGLVWQWCSDWYAPYTADSLLENPRGPERVPDTTLWNGVIHRAGRVIRGGSFSYPDRFAECCHRHFSIPGDRNVNLGFRVVSDVPAAGLAAPRSAK